MIGQIAAAECDAGHSPAQPAFPSRRRAPILAQRWQARPSRSRNNPKQGYSAALGIGVTDQVLQPHLGAVMGKITVLTAIILFLQWRPAGIFATRGRGLEG